MADARDEHAHDQEPMWTEDEWRERSDYADLVTVEVRFRSWLGAEEADEAWLLTANGAAWPRDWLSWQLGELAAREGGGCCGNGTYQLSVREHHTEWGASSSMWEATLTLAEAMLASGTWAGLGMLAENMRRRLRERNGEWEGAEEALVDEWVRDAAVRAVAQLRDLALRELDVRSVEITGKETAMVELRDAKGAVYSVEVHETRGVMLARVRKITEA